MIYGILSSFLEEPGGLRYLLRKLIKSNFCKHSLYVGFDLRFSRPRILLNDDLERL